LNLRHDIVDLRSITSLISNSALTSVEHDAPGFDKTHAEGQTIEVPEGHYAEDSMKATVVPNRNMMMLSIAGAVAINYGYSRIATGVHGGDHFIYPDCRPTFISYVQDAIAAGNEGFHKFPFNDALAGYEAIYAPYLNETKADIAFEALRLNVPLHLTWSCYKGVANHCGRCGTCVERLEAIDEAATKWVRALKEQTGGSVFGVANLDKTIYDDTEFWKTQVKSNAK
jgi:7-cyano-7-deazaguanine synthase